jgi:leishmanolysin-like peptidase
LHAPCEEVDELYADTSSDNYKVMGAMVTELDYGVGNVTAALQAQHTNSGRDWLMLLAADNGGPINIASANYPYRGGKHTMWDGGLRVVAFLSGSLIPATRRGTEWTGLACHADWFATIVEGVAKLDFDRNATGPASGRAMDSLNLWDAILVPESAPGR